MLKKVKRFYKHIEKIMVQMLFRHSKSTKDGTQKSLRNVDLAGKKRKEVEVYT